MNELAERWLVFAWEDLRVAERIMEDEIFNQVCFHSQQCVEKTLKGALISRDISPPRSHSITDLLSLFPSDWLADWRDDLTALDDYYIPTRYPDALPGSLPEGMPGHTEAKEALELAKAVYGQVSLLVLPKASDNESKQQ